MSNQATVTNVELPPVLSDDPDTPQAGDATATGGEGEAWRTQPGWVIQLDGHHFHNGDPNNEGAQFIINTFFKNLEEGTVALPDGPEGALVDVPIADLGIHHPVLITQFRIEERTYDPEATDAAAGQGYESMRGMSMERTPAVGEDGLPLAEAEGPKQWKLRQYDFRIQFAWQPVPRGKRLEKKAQESAELAETAGGEDVAATTDSSSG